MNRFEQHVENLTLIRENDFPTPRFQRARRHLASSSAVRSGRRPGFRKTLCAMFLVCGLAAATAKTVTAASSTPGTLRTRPGQRTFIQASPRTAIQAIRRTCIQIFGPRPYIRGLAQLIILAYLDSRIDR